MEIKFLKAGTRYIELIPRTNSAAGEPKRGLIGRASTNSALVKQAYLTESFFF